MLACDFERKPPGRPPHPDKRKFTTTTSLPASAGNPSSHFLMYLPLCHQDRNGSSSMLNLCGQIIALHSVRFAILGWAKKLQNFSLSVSYSIINREQVPKRFRLPLSGEGNPR
jgi:hypothetical protein